MQNQYTNRRQGMLAIIGFIVGLMALTNVALAQGKVTQRPIKDFLSTQGTSCNVNVPGCHIYIQPDPNFFGFGNYGGRWASTGDLGGWNHVSSAPARTSGVDYAGLAKEAYSPGKEPIFEGTVTERPLADGTAEVTVLLHTQNANIWVVDIDPAGDYEYQVDHNPTVFGHRPRDVQNGAGQALADSFLKAVFINSAPGALLPDLLTAKITFLSFKASAQGPLTAAFGVPEGTPGQCKIVQDGLLGVSAPGRGLQDGFPVEFINLQVVGK